MWATVSTIMHLMQSASARYSELDLLCFSPRFESYFRSTKFDYFHLLQKRSLCPAILTTSKNAPHPFTTSPRIPLSLIRAHILYPRRRGSYSYIDEEDNISEIVLRKMRNEHIASLMLLCCIMTLYSAVKFPEVGMPFGGDVRHTLVVEADHLASRRVSAICLHGRGQH